MTKLKMFVVATCVLAGTIASLIIRHQALDRLGERENAIRQQDEQAAKLLVEQRRLSNLVARADSPSATDPTNELARLRAEADALRKQTNELGQQRKQSQAKRVGTTDRSEKTPEYFEQLSQSAGARSRDAMTLGRALYEYAYEHQRQAPPSLEAAAAYLAKMTNGGSAWSGTNHFELIFQGSLDRIEGLPWGSVAFVRSETWLTPDGQQARVYGFPDGHSQRVVSDDNFESWEEKHVVLAPSTNQ